MADEGKADALMTLYAHAYEGSDEDEELDDAVEKTTTEMLTMMVEVASMRLRLKRLQNPFFKERMQRFMAKTNTKKTQSE